MTQSTPYARVFATEFAAVTLWITTTLLVYVATTTPALQGVAPVAADYSPMTVFLALLVGIMAVWEALGLSLGSPFNPAVTLALAIGGDVPAARVPAMWPGQFLGHVFSVFVVRAVSARAFADAPAGVLRPPAPHADLSFARAVGVEAGVTGAVCLAALSLKHVLAADAKVARFAVMNGLVIAALAGGGEWTGSCMNPAMHFAMALVEGHWAAHSVYWLGPVLGAVAAGCAYRGIFGAAREAAAEAAGVKQE